MAWFAFGALVRAQHRSVGSTKAHNTIIGGNSKYKCYSSFSLYFVISGYFEISKACVKSGQLILHFVLSAIQRAGRFPGITNILKIFSAGLTKC